MVIGHTGDKDIHSAEWESDAENDTIIQWKSHVSICLASAVVKTVMISRNSIQR